MRFFLALLIFISATTGACAADVPASEDSIKELIEVTHADRLMDSMMANMDAYMQTAIKQAAGSTKLTPEQQAIMDDMRKKMAALLTSEMSWETLEPDYISIYQKSFTEQEISDLLVFYKTQTGQALINKMPIVMQNVMVLMQKRMAVIGPKLQHIQKESVEQMKACCANGT